MKSTSSALTPRKIAEFCKGPLTTIFTEGEVRLLYGCLLDLLERAESCGGLEGTQSVNRGETGVGARHAGHYPDCGGGV